MNVEDLREYCLAMPGVTEGLPFNDTALVFKVYGKIFALLDLSEVARGISLKCDPDRAVQLRGTYSEIQGGYHLNKEHWNTIKLGGKVPDDLMKEMVVDSYNLIYSSLPKKKREEIEGGINE